MNDDRKELLEEIQKRIAVAFDGLSRRFDAIDDRFAAVDSRFDEMKRHSDVTAESLRGEIRQVAEGVLTVDEKLGRFRGDMDEFRTDVNRRFDDMQTIMRSRSWQNGHHTD